MLPRCRGCGGLRPCWRQSYSGTLGIGAPLATSRAQLSRKSCGVRIGPPRSVTKRRERPREISWRIASAQLKSQAVAVVEQDHAHLLRRRVIKPALEHLDCVRPREHRVDPQHIEIPAFTGHFNVHHPEVGREAQSDRHRTATTGEGLGVDPSARKLSDEACWQSQRRFSVRRGHVTRHWWRPQGALDRGTCPGIRGNAARHHRRRKSRTPVVLKRGAVGVRGPRRRLADRRCLRAYQRRAAS
mmetsp:Transcript_1142/g.2707  ORF Transcript_1142/g.2707 Transcript_1142/m.2707 type:complete len:243 (+) Transcript_1142:1365-2093(+)